jgi:hypothetical protein
VSAQVELPFSEPSVLTSEVSDPAHWLISEHVLFVHFEIDVFPGVVGAAIAWGNMKAYLRAPLPFAIPSN